MLSAHRVSVKRQDRVLLDRISLKVRPGEVWAILGPNGAGKSTLLSCLSGDLAPDSGEVRLAGRDPAGLPPQQLAHIRSVMAQSTDVGFSFPAKEVVALGLYTHGGSWRVRDRHKNSLQAAMAATEVLHLADRPYPVLSGGEKRRVQLARVLLQLRLSETRPQVLFLDEPTAGLDVKHALSVVDLARKLAGEEDYAVVIVLHDFNLATRCADQVLILKDGAQIAQGSVKKALTPSVIERAFEVRAGYATSDFSADRHLVLAPLEG